MAFDRVPVSSPRYESSCVGHGLDPYYPRVCPRGDTAGSGPLLRACTVRTYALG